MDMVWLMGVWQRSPRSRKISLHDPGFQGIIDTLTPDWTPADIIGSAYAISAHGPDPLIGSWEDIDQAREKLHQRNMGLVLDFIPNHTGADHNWVFDHPEYYIHGSEADYQKDPANFFILEVNNRLQYIAHGRDPNFPGWTDTAQLNYFNPQTRAALLKKLEILAGHCDGIRCDMAMLVMNEIFQRDWGWANRDPEYPLPTQEFWSEVTQKIPGLVYIAEAYWDTEWALQQLGFDFVYDKRLYDRLKSGHPQDVYLHLKAEMAYQSKLVRFIENHDEQRSLTAFGRSKAPAAATLFATLPGMKLYFQGQTDGLQLHLPIQIRRSRLESVDPEIQAFYPKLLAEVNTAVFHSGTWQLKEVIREGNISADNLVAYSWQQDAQLRLVITNLNQHPAQGRIYFTDSIEEKRDYVCTEIFSGDSFRQSGEILGQPGWVFNLSGYQAQIWEIEAIE
jgi:hypothetical protein